MVYFRYFPLNNNLPDLLIRHSRESGYPLPPLRGKAGWGGIIRSPVVFILCIAFLFTGCATSTTTHRTPAKVEDRTASPETAPPAPVQEEPSARVYKLEEPEYVAPQAIPDTVVEDLSAEFELQRQLELEEAPTQPVELPTSSSPAVVALLNDADKLAITGKNQEAVASIERAIRIEPKNPVLWHKLGKVRLQEGKWDQAIAMAKKSNVLAAGNRLLQSENWMIIAKASEGKGDTAGAMHANDMAKQLRTY